MAESVAEKEAPVRCHKLSKRYGDKLVLDAVSLRAEAGEVLAMIGHNGAGKTTLFKLILGLSRSSGGSIRVLGHDPWRMSAAARLRYGFLPENVSFHGAMTGREVMRFFARLKRTAVAGADALLDQVGMGRAADSKVQTYSKGMRQRLGLAQALLGKPELLLLDEPTTGLDPFLRRDLEGIVDRCKARGVTVLVSTHSLGEIEARADRIAILAGGRLAACGTVAELRAAARLPVQIRIETAPGGAPAVADCLKGEAEIQSVNDHTLRLRCADRRKLSIIQRIGARGEEVEDVEIVTPRLQDLYAHFVERDGLR